MPHLAVGRTLELGQDAFALLDAADNGWVIAVSQLDGCQSLAVEPRDLLRDGVPRTATGCPSGRRVALTICYNQLRLTVGMKSDPLVHDSQGVGAITVVACSGVDVDVVQPRLPRIFDVIGWLQG